MSKEVTRQEALELLLKWAVECDFGLDNIALDYGGDWDESKVQRKVFEERTKDMSYTESLIEYARIYLESLPESSINENGETEEHLQLGGVLSAIEKLKVEYEKLEAMMKQDVDTAKFLKQVSEVGQTAFKITFSCLDLLEELGED